MHFAADHENREGAAGSDQLVCNREPVNETAALIANVERQARLYAEPLVKQRRVPGEVDVGAQRAAHDRVDVGGLQPGYVERAPRCDLGERNAAAIVVDVASFAYPGTFHDPFVGRVDERSEVIVRDHGLRYLETPPENPAALRRLAHDLRRTPLTLEELRSPKTHPRPRSPARRSRRSR